MDPIVPIIALSLILGAIIASLIFGNYFRKQKSEVESLTKGELVNNVNDKKPSKPSQSKKYHVKHHSQGSDKEQSKKHHVLDLNTLKGHGDAVGGLCFSFDGRNLATENLGITFYTMCVWYFIWQEHICDRSLSPPFSTPRRPMRFNHSSQSCQV